MKKLTILILVVLALQNYIQAQTQIKLPKNIALQLSEILGKTVAIATKELQIDQSKVSIINDPPCVNRGISYDFLNGDKIYIYVPRGSIKIDPNKCFSEATDFDDIKISGVAYLHKGVWFTKGNILSYYHYNINQE